MSPFVQNEMSVPNRNGDDIYNDIVESITLTKASVEECLELTDNKKLRDKLQYQNVEIEQLKQLLDEKAKQLHDLNGCLERKKADRIQYKNQCSSNFQISQDVFKDTKVFKSKVVNEIHEKISNFGFEIDYYCVEDQISVKIQKDERWFELRLNDQLRLELFDMNPRHSRFDEIKVLFDSTRNLRGLFSIYNWKLGK